MWHAICHYPLRQRPRAIPATLIRDAAQRTQRALSRPTTATLSKDVAEPATVAELDRACDRIDLQRAIGASNLSADDLQLLTMTRMAAVRSPQARKPPAQANAATAPNVASATTSPHGNCALLHPMHEIRAVAAE